MKSDNFGLLVIVLAIVGFYALLNFVVPPQVCEGDYQACKTDAVNSRL